MGACSRIELNQVGKDGGMTRHPAATNKTGSPDGTACGSKQFGPLVCGNLGCFDGRRAVATGRSNQKNTKATLQPKRHWALHSACRYPPVKAMTRNPGKSVPPIV